MKRFEVYTNIRKQAAIFGLTVSTFALFMASVIGSLLLVIFSFSLATIGLSVVWNCTFFIILIQITHNPNLFHFGSVFPHSISTKKTNSLHYEE